MGLDWLLNICRLLFGEFWEFDITISYTTQNLQCFLKPCPHDSQPNFRNLPQKHQLNKDKSFSLRFQTGNGKSMSTLDGLRSLWTTSTSCKLCFPIAIAITVSLTFLCVLNRFPIRCVPFSCPSASVNHSNIFSQRDNLVGQWRQVSRVLSDGFNINQPPHRCAAHTVVALVISMRGEKCGEEEASCCIFSCHWISNLEGVAGARNGFDCATKFECPSTC